MSRPTRFFDFLNNTYMPTEKINTATGFDLRLFRLTAKVTEGFSPVKASKGQNPPKGQGLKAGKTPGVGLQPGGKMFCHRPAPPGQEPEAPEGEKRLARACRCG